MNTNKKILSTAVAAASLVAAFACGAPEGYENADGIWLGGKLNISPFIELGYYNDDNPNSVRDITKKQIDERKQKLLDAGLPDDKEYNYDDSDFFSYKLGANLLLPGNHWKLSGRTFFVSETYSNDSIDDHTDWYESLILSGETDGETSWKITEVYQDIRYDEDFELTQNDRSEFSLIAEVEKSLTDKSALSISAFFRNRDYDDDYEVVYDENGDVAYENDGLYDYVSYGGNLGYSHTFTEKTAWTLSLAYTLHDKDEYDSNAYGINAMVGLRTIATEKISFDVAAGAEYFEDFEYTYEDAEGVEHGLDAEDEIGFTYSIAAKWQPTRRLFVELKGYSEFEPAEDVRDNSVYSSSLAAIATYRPGENWSLRGGIEYRREDYTRDIDEELAELGIIAAAEDGGDNRTDDEIAAFARVSYALARYCSVFVDWRYTDITSSVDGYDYDRQRYGAGIALKY